MDFRANPFVDRYYESVADFAATATTPDQIEQAWASGTAHDSDLHTAIARRGWIGAAWPRSAGGLGMHPAEVGALWEALNYYRLPVDVWELTEMAAWVVLQTGSDQQRAEILPQVRAGNLLMALGYTEADSGSDVAAASTTATATSTGWIVRGSKMFTTGANIADYALLLARTDPGVAKHRGLSLFLAPLKHSAVEIRPVHTLGGERTNAIFFDDLPLLPGAVVGAVNGGWAGLTVGLNYERTLMGTYVGRAMRLLHDLLAALRESGLPRITDQEYARSLSDLGVRIEAARALCDDVACRIAGGREYAVSAAMAKLEATEAFKDLAYLALEAVGPVALTDQSLAPGLRDGCLEHAFRHSQIATIYGGSSEIQRNIIASQGLQLPRT